MTKRDTLIELNQTIALHVQKLAEHTTELTRMAGAGTDITEGAAKLAKYAETLRQLIEVRNQLARETDPDRH